LLGLRYTSKGEVKMAELIAWDW